MDKDSLENLLFSTVMYGIRRPIKTIRLVRIIARPAVHLELIYAPERFSLYIHTYRSRPTSNIELFF